MEFGDKGDTAMAIALMRAVDDGELYDPRTGQLFESEVLSDHFLLRSYFNTWVYRLLVEGIVRARQPEDAIEDDERVNMAMTGLLGIKPKRGRKVEDIRDELLAMMELLHDGCIPDEILVDSSSWKCPDIDIAPIARQVMEGREYANVARVSVERNLAKKFRENYAAIMAVYLTEDWLGQKAYAIAKEIESVMKRHKVPIKL